MRALDALIEADTFEAAKAAALALPRELEEALPYEFFGALREALSRSWDRFTDSNELTVENGTDYQLAVERWCLAAQTLAGMRSEFGALADSWSIAESLANEVLGRIRISQERWNVRLHKGSPYFAVAVTQIYKGDIAEAREAFILAIFEDSLTTNNWRSLPASQTFQRFFDREEVDGEIWLMSERLDHMSAALHDFAYRNPELLLLPAVAPIERDLRQHLAR